MQLQAPMSLQRGALSQTVSSRQLTSVRARRTMDAQLDAQNRVHLGALLRTFEPIKAAKYRAFPINR